MQVAKWGNSLAVRLPGAVVEALKLKEGDNIEIEIAGARRFEIRKAPGARELLARLRKYRGACLPISSLTESTPMPAAETFSITAPCFICFRKMRPRPIGWKNLSPMVVS